MQSALMVRDSLAKISKMNKLNKWLFETIEPFLGNRILDAGCGNGNITKYLKEKELVIAIDNNEQIINDIKKNLAVSVNLKVINFDISDSQMIPLLQKDNIDTILCINTLEHIKNDSCVIKNFYDILNPGGKLIILIPALKFLYSTLDEAAGHCRRYSKKEIVSKVRDGGFSVENVAYFNLFGTLGWFIQGKILKKRELSDSLLSIFENLVDIFIFLENSLHFPFGLSLLLIAHKDIGSIERNTK
ncbi:MAG: class I SAM-dependent methyltransferase [Candidatus Omnitrophica bacterium]|nr:class I SAM-dependent methyltransferase [Candidatus Omnitrophota bacterium]MDD5352375.1 class I SAM-dependent methyltransferase [Candidatus Omnitrophota bacterium]MDD5549973.1 class I SAM-dependent methyltransferase [Candidatus Omnitrophota bacterium]